ncbi:MAG: hypothetical protein ABIP94_24580 [Planctomycetota bacterium]
MRSLAIHRTIARCAHDGVIAAIATFDDQEVSLRAAGAQAVHNFYDEAGVGLAEHALRVLDEKVRVAP